MAKAALALPYTGLHGSLGGTTIVQRPDGPVVRARNYRPRKLTPGQAAGATRLRLVGEAWRGLDDATFQAWRAFARRSAWRNPASGAIVTPQPYRLFSGLASKALQAEPGRSLKGFAPPEREFGGDGVLLRVEVGGARAEGDGGGEACPHPALPQGGGTPIATPTSVLPKDADPVVTFFSDRANAPGVVTEVLVQPLVNARRAVYGDKYASRGFVAFEGAESVEVPVKPGAYACAFRFVRPATGQETAIFEVGVVVVR